MPFIIVKNDITKMKVDAIVNAANVHLKIGGGVCGAIFNGAGEVELKKACEALAPIKTGEAVITPGFNLPAKFIIHTAGPIYFDGNQGEEELLRSSYRNSLRLAVEKGCESIAFPLISSGIYGYPKEQALRVASEAIREFIMEEDINVYLVVFDREVFEPSRRLLYEIDSYILENYSQDPSLILEKLSSVEARVLEDKFIKDEGVLEKDQVKGIVLTKEVAKIVEDIDGSFGETLMSLIDLKQESDVEIYKRANLDRKLFSKIRTNPEYKPSKRTAIALALALKLSLEETQDFLLRAGYALSPFEKFDVIIEYFIVMAKYDIYEINAVLFKYDQPLLGS